jgi:hypothetical protein
MGKRERKKAYKDMRDCAVETLDKLGWEPEND